MTPTRTLLSACLVICLVSGCARTPPKPVVSPDGSMVAFPDSTGELLITINSKDGTELYRWNTGASPNQWWAVRWTADQSLLMESADIGAYTLERLPDGSWRESTPGGVFSPDGKWKVQTSWDSKETRRLKVWVGEVTGRNNFSGTREFQTDLVISAPDPFNCARWDGNNRVIVKTADGEHSWTKSADRTWTREK